MTSVPVALGERSYDITIAAGALDRAGELLAPYASRQAYIYRREPGAAKQEIAIELEKIMKRKSPDVPLEANDILYIPDNTGKRATMTALEKFILTGSALGAALVYAGVR